MSKSTNAKLADKFLKSESAKYSKESKRLLQAAAPDLLKACEVVLDWATRECMPMGGKYDGPWEVIEAAINKARGNS